MDRFKLAAVKVAGILVPTYAVAVSTEQMVYTIPMLAAATVFVTTMDFDSFFLKEDPRGSEMNEGSTTTAAATDLTDSDSIDGDG